MFIIIFFWLQINAKAHMRCYYFYILGNESGPVYSLLLSGNMIGEIVLCILSHTKVKSDLHEGA